DTWTNFQGVSADFDTALIVTGYRKLFEGVGLAEYINRMSRAFERRQAKEKRVPATRPELAPGGLLRKFQEDYLARTTQEES
ncbi:MAG: hypothetical protein V3T23_05325, partial [Nitrososphaerales archaeon]